MKEGEIALVMNDTKESFERYRKYQNCFPPNQKSDQIC